MSHIVSVKAILIVGLSLILAALIVIALAVFEVFDLEDDAPAAPVAVVDAPSPPEPEVEVEDVVEDVAEAEPNVEGESGAEAQVTVEEVEDEEIVEVDEPVIHPTVQLQFWDDPVTLIIAPEGSREGYDRALFGTEWLDEDMDGCNTRQEVLIRESSTARPIDVHCSLSRGLWFSLWDGVITENWSDIAIAHMIPLAEAWESGASAWTTEQRIAFANDLSVRSTLQTATSTVIQARGDQDVSEWLPGLDERDEEGKLSGQCLYVAQWVTVKSAWELTVDPEELEVLTDFEVRCRDLE